MHFFINYLTLKGFYTYKLLFCKSRSSTNKKNIVALHLPSPHSDKMQIRDYFVVLLSRAECRSPPFAALRHRDPGGILLFPSR